MNHEFLLSRKARAELRGDQLNDNDECVNERFIFRNALCFCDASRISRTLLFKGTRAAVTSGCISAHGARGKPSTGRISVGVSTVVVATIVPFTTMLITVSVTPSARKSKAWESK